jgi:DNA-binding beta-propeller fold protein YncE
VRGSCLITAFSVLLVVLSTQLSYADSLPKRLYLSNNPSGGPYSIVAVDLTTNTEVTPAIPVTAEPGELAASPDGSKVYVVVGTDLKVIDVLSNTITSSIAGAGGFQDFNHVAVAPDGSKVYVASRIANPLSPATVQIQIADTSSNTLVGSITNTLFDGCYAPLGLGISPDGSKLYTACRPNSTSLPDRFYVIDSATHAVTLASTFTRDGTNASYINAITVSPSGNEVYMGRTSSSLSTIEIFDGATGANLASIQLPAKALPRAEVVTLDGSRLYVADERLGVHVIDLTTRTYVSTMATSSSRGFDISMSPDGSRAYTSLTTNIFMNDTSSNSLIGTITGSYTFVRQMTTASGGGTASTNHPPVANAGPDQSVAVCNQVTAAVALDGSGSTDPDGDALTYTWTGPFGTASGANPTVTLPLGTNAITLSVSDGHATSTASVNVTVSQNMLFNFNGFLEPILNDGSSEFKIGRVVPIKFKLTDCSGAEVTTAVATLAVYKILDQPSGTVEEVTVEAAGNSDEGNLFRYSDGNYIYNLDTNPYGEGTYRLDVHIDDNSIHSVDVSMVEQFQND